MKDFLKQSPELIAITAMLGVLIAALGCIAVDWIGRKLTKDLLPPPDPSCQRTTFNEWEDTQ
jgi:hypothetical protein